MKIIRVKTTADKIDTSPRTVWRYANDPDYEDLEFPKPVDIGPNCTGFVESEIDDWIAKRAAMREAPEPKGKLEPEPSPESPTPESEAVAESGPASEQVA